MESYAAADVREEPAASLLAEYFAERERTFPVPGGYRTRRPDPADFTTAGGVFLVVADEGGAPIGCGGIRRLGAAAAGARFEVKHLYLRPDARGAGLGRRLLAELERRARLAGASELVLDTNDSLAAAGALYRGRGFRRIPAYNDNPNATSWYRKPLK